MSLMAFRGGPMDGQSKPTHEGFPAPDKCRAPGCADWYVRAETVFDRDSGGTTHYYDYEGADHA